VAILLTSILDADWSKLADEVRAVDNARTDGISVDIMDGIFVPRTTFGPHIVSIVRNITDLPLEVHLMVVKPENHVEKYCDAGADQVVIHFEATDDPLSLVNYIHSRGVSAGLALLQETPLEVLTDSLIESIDTLLLMSVPVGFGGQKPLPQTIDRIKAIRERVKNMNPDLAIEIDGGMKPDNCTDYAVAGADGIVIGTGIYKSDNYENAINTARTNLASDEATSRRRLKDFLSCPSINSVNDHERRKRLNQIRIDMDIPEETWAPLKSAR